MQRKAQGDEINETLSCHGAKTNHNINMSFNNHDIILYPHGKPNNPISPSPALGLGPDVPADAIPAQGKNAGEAAGGGLDAPFGAIKSIPKNSVILGVCYALAATRRSNSACQDDDDIVAKLIPLTEGTVALISCSSGSTAGCALVAEPCNIGAARGDAPRAAKELDAPHPICFRPLKASSSNASLESLAGTPNVMPGEVTRPALVGLLVRC
jgi:hypothetical protein